MPSTADIAFWALIAVADLFVAYIFVLWGVAREFRWLTVYFACRVLASVVEYVFLWNSGWDSWTYAYVYYIADAILQVILFECWRTGAAKREKVADCKTAGAPLHGGCVLSCNFQ